MRGRIHSLRQLRRPLTLASLDLSPHAGRGLPAVRLNLSPRDGALHKERRGDKTRE
jgi:hypothetical protein